MSAPPPSSPADNATEVDVLVYGAGAIGQYLGARLADGGLHVHLIGRAPLVRALAEHGVEVTDLDGTTRRVPEGQITAGETLADAPPARLVLLTVKSGATAQAAADLQAGMPAGTPVISFQNGIENAQRLRHGAPLLEAIAGMVPYNVILNTPGAPRRTSDGHLAVARTNSTEAWAPAFARAGLSLQLHEDLLGVQWGKLILNLNNPINALSGKPLREQLLDSGYRSIVADMQSEALQALAAAQIAPVKAMPLPPTWTPRLLRMPTPVFRAVAARMLRIDPLARSSMQDDRRAGRATEIDDLCGAVVRLAQQYGTEAPINQAIVEQVKTAPTGEYFSATQLRTAITKLAGGDA